MTNPSNLYAEKIFSEHPIALWSLDEDCDYVSLVPPSVRSMSNWVVSGGTVSNQGTVSRRIEKSSIIKITTQNSNSFTAISPNTFNLNSLNPNRESFSISTYFYSATSAISEVRIGYEYTLNGNVVRSLESYNLSVADSWVFLTKKNVIPDVDAEVRVIVEVDAETAGNFEFYLNGLSVGQWSEKFNLYSDGVDLSPIPEDIALEGLGYPAYSYGISDNPGYYIGSANTLFAYNDGIPMVYGASSVTKIIPNESGPSLIIPGQGFLNEVGRYQELTFEAWIKVLTSSSSPRRIVGPIASSDGIYIDGAFVALKIGSFSRSHFVGEWARPMLVHLRMSGSSASLLLNGEIVISMDIDISAVDLPSQKSSSGNKDQDWIGFYAYEDVPLLEVDCVAIYSYQVPEIVAKRRFAYGQAVDLPENSSGALSEPPFLIDYRVSGYANNYIYPDTGRWSQAITENVSTTQNVLSTINYQLPDVVFRNSDISTAEWLQLCNEDLGLEDAPSANLALADSADASGGYILFPRLNLLSQDTASLYGIFRATNVSGETLFRLENGVNGSYLSVTTQDGRIKYTFSYPNQPLVEILSNEELEPGLLFVAGIDIRKMSTSYGGLVSKFLSASKRLAVYVGGDSSFENTFSGQIYKIGFSNQRNLRKLSNIIQQNGTLWASAANAESALDHIASYTFGPRRYLGNLDLDISTDSYWQDYVPLSYFGKKIKTLDGDNVQSLDFIQLNIDVPDIKTLSGQFSNSHTQVRSYISFQYLSTGANRPMSAFSQTEPISNNSVIAPGANWLQTLYEFTDNTVIYMPQRVNFRDLAIVIHIQIDAMAVIKNPIRIKKLELASQAISVTEPMTISTRTGAQIEAYIKRGLYPDYRGVNPLTISKGSNPYLYLTSKSGIKISGSFVANEFRGAYIPMNSQRSNNYSVGAIQSFINYPHEKFPENPVPIMEIKAYDRTSIIYLVSDNLERTRGRIYAINTKTQLPDQLLNFYLNGKLVKNPYITPNEWDVLSFQFVRGLVMDNFRGTISIVGPLLFNNVSIHRLTEIQTSITSIFRTWAQVPKMIDKAGDEDTYWEDFITSDPVITWENILFIPTIKTYLIDPEVIFRSYTGTNKSIVSDRNVLRIKDYQYRAYKDILWRSNIITPV
jgi:hypothetical protein